MGNILFKEDKKQLRIILTQKINKMSTEEKQSHSQRICKIIELSPLWLNRTALFAYYPLGKELDISPLLHRAWENDEIPLALPRISGSTMTFHRVTQWNKINMQPNKWGILEPLGEWELLNPHDFEHPLMILPGLGFTEKGKRLGRGGGFYDRYLNENLRDCTQLTKWGVAYPCQLCRDIPTEPHDVSLDKIIY
jgi:5-formyltetrahydrofolate cyclo-ligase